MTTQTINSVFLNYDHLHPVATKDVTTAGLDITVDRFTRPAQAAASDPDAHLVEVSWSRYIRGLSEGVRDWVGLPLFPRRCFGHRAWYTRRDLGYTGFEDIAGGRVGTNEWPATGNTWARAAAREAGIDLKAISWVVGSIDGGPTGRDDELPSHVTYAGEGVHMVDLLLHGELDALVCPAPPANFYEEDSPVVRLLADPWAAEREYFQRTGIYPAHHIAALRREVFDARPEVAIELFTTFERGRREWQASRTRLGDTSPWVLADIERARDLMGVDWQPGGIDANAHMTAALCEELFEQGLIETRVDPAIVFEDFARLIG